MRQRTVATSRVLIGFIALSSLVLAGCGTKSISSEPQPPASVGTATRLGLPGNVLAAPFLDQGGRTVTLGGLKGRTVFLVPLLTLCGDTCPFTSGNMLQLYDELTARAERNIVLVAVSVDPYRDSVRRLAAYARLIGARFELWTPFGPTSIPMPPPHYSGTDSVGTGDTNAQLTIFEHFFGWASQVVKEPRPIAIDWLAPHRPLTYDISHSDGFWIISSHGVVRFESGSEPQFHGVLATALARFLNSDGQHTYRHPSSGGWTPAQAREALAWVVGKNL